MEPAWTDRRIFQGTSHGSTGQARWRPARAARSATNGSSPAGVRALLPGADAISSGWLSKSANRLGVGDSRCHGALTANPTARTPHRTVGTIRCFSAAARATIMNRDAAIADAVRLPISPPRLRHAQQIERLSVGGKRTLPRLRFVRCAPGPFGIETFGASIERRLRDLVLFDIAIDSKPRGRLPPDYFGNGHASIDIKAFSRLFRLAAEACTRASLSFAPMRGESSRPDGE